MQDVTLTKVGVVSNDVTFMAICAPQPLSIQPILEFNTLRHGIQPFNTLIQGDLKYRKTLFLYMNTEQRYSFRAFILVKVSC
jgi:hypothetical protein